VVLLNSLGTDLHLWDDTLDALQARIRTVRFDYPGHGDSGAWQADSTSGMARALLAALDASGIERFALCGVSLGGAIAIEAALQAPHRLTAMLVSNTATHFGTPEFWNERMGLARAHGIAAIAEATVVRWLAHGKGDAAYPRLRSMFESTTLEGYLQCAAVVRDHDLRGRLAALRVHTTVLVGTHDVATTPAAGRELAQLIDGARLAELPTAHLACADCPKDFAALLLDSIS
jgi:3-oxoadipate enol-lactonase